jgi:hypothetical protein
MPSGDGKRSRAGRPVGSGSGKAAITKSISMLPDDWLVLDKLRGEASRGVLVRAMVWQRWQQAQENNLGSPRASA